MLAACRCRWRRVLRQRTVSVSKEQRPATPYRTYRQNIGRAILLGLEFLVAGDIIRTVVVSPTIRNVIALGLIGLIRSFLSMSLEVRRVWRSGSHSSAHAPSSQGLLRFP